MGNKCDLEEERVVSTERGKQLADQLGKSFTEVFIIQADQTVNNSNSCSYHHDSLIFLHH